ncbi:MAG: periplasmic heavy metal sensor [Pseudomonadota bacterium]
MRASRLRWALLASFILNVVFLGAIIGAFLADRGPGDARRSGDGGQAEMVGLVRGLDGPERRNLVRTLRRDEALREARSKLRSARGALQAALRSDPYDPAAVEGALEDQLAAQQAVVARGMEIALDVLGQLSVEERNRLIDEMSARRRRRD